MRRTTLLLASTSVLAIAATVMAQRGQAPIEWLPAADSLPAKLATLLILDGADRTPVEHPWVCVDPSGGWMLGMSDGRLRFSHGDLGDTVRLRVSGPWHEERAVALPWTKLEGRAAIILLTRRARRVEPTC